MAKVKLGLHLRGRRGAPSEGSIFKCIGMLALAVGPSLTKLLQDQLDLIFACGLSEPLRQALARIVDHIPALLKTIQDRLLNVISHTLSGQPYRQLGEPTQKGERKVTVRHHGGTQVRLECYFCSVTNLARFRLPGLGKQRRSLSL